MQADAKKLRKRRDPPYVDPEEPRQDPGSVTDNIPHDILSLQGETFASWQEFESAFKEYFDDTSQELVKRASTSRVARNKRLTQIHADRRDEVPESELFHDEFFPCYLVSYVCTNGGEPRNRGSGNFRVKPFAQLAVRRRMKIPAKHLATVDMLCKAGLSRRKLLRFIWDNTSCEPDMVNVHNLLAKPKCEEDAGTILSDDLKLWIGFVKRNPFTVAHIDIHYQREMSTHMRSLLSAFPEVLLMDATHRTNASRYKLFSFMVHDSFGRGQHVTLYLPMKRRIHFAAITKFKKCNPSSTEMRCIVVDKDFTEICVVKSEFPEARVLLCQFHAITYIQERIAKTEYGLDAVQRARLKPLASLIVRAQSKEEH
ncbi:LOW QUALITY PROTEIN: hypothetical protein PHMEG_00017738 [Phytophthora megakarya]|uniref:ZSWIM1/3 RNaseH-like domain-containing protein n=1 Tax=Phytophthora megakarya TaxID=4795 RepID=A0A225VVU1_9STRA|nr:LOW QUALITY PROTEIN: hypothetical protein PHMEG_00017738 [Phytophthora megakarya]